MARMVHVWPSFRGRKMQRKTPSSAGHSNEAPSEEIVLTTELYGRGLLKIRLRIPRNRGLVRGYHRDDETPAIPPQEDAAAKRWLFESQWITLSGENEYFDCMACGGNAT